MIHVTIFQNKYKECVGFQTEGHAEYADPGQDIVCAAASILVINTINAIEEFTEDDASLISEDSSIAFIVLITRIEAAAHTISCPGFAYSACPSV